MGGRLLPKNKIKFTGGSAGSSFSNFEWGGGSFQKIKIKFTGAFGGKFIFEFRMGGGSFQKIKIKLMGGSSFQRGYGGKLILKVSWREAHFKGFLAGSYN